MMQMREDQELPSFLQAAGWKSRFGSRTGSRTLALPGTPAVWMFFCAIFVSLYVVTHVSVFKAQRGQALAAQL